jgi:tRNA-dihydrouridine synthase B
MNPILILAPLQGVTDRVFRTVFSRHFSGLDAAVAPFISTRRERRFKPSQLAALLPENNTGLPVVPQIMGNDPDDFIALAEVLADLGHATVNWNLGCPFPMVVKKMRGCGLLGHPERIAAFLERVVPRISCRLSIKTRLGLQSAAELLDLMPIFNRFPLAEVIIHSRLGSQRYSGQPDLTSFGECLARCAHPVIYNGDLHTLETYRQISRRFPTVTRWMLGRGVVANPFLPAMIKTGQDPGADQIHRLRCFHDDLFSGYQRVFAGPGHLLDRMKGFWYYFAQTFENSRRIMKKIHRLQRPERYREVVDRFFAAEARWNPSAVAFKEG